MPLTQARFAKTSRKTSETRRRSPGPRERPTREEIPRAALCPSACWHAIVLRRRPSRPGPRVLQARSASSVFGTGPAGAADHGRSFPPAFQETGSQGTQPRGSSGRTNLATIPCMSPPIPQGFWIVSGRLPEDRVLCDHVQLRLPQVNPRKYVSPSTAMGPMPSVLMNPWVRIASHPSAQEGPGPEDAPSRRQEGATLVLPGASRRLWGVTAVPDAMFGWHLSRWPSRVRPDSRSRGNLWRTEAS